MADVMMGKATTVDSNLNDYMIGSPFILSKVRHFYVHRCDSLFSDEHCVVEVLLDVNPGMDYYWAD